MAEQKHGFPEDRAGEVRIELEPVEGSPEIRLCVSDTGVGPPPELDSERPTSLGLQLVSDLVKQLHGRLEVRSGPGTGAVFEVTFAPDNPTKAAAS